MFKKLRKIYRSVRDPDPTVATIQAPGNAPYHVGMFLRPDTLNRDDLLHPVRENSIRLQNHPRSSIDIKALCITSARSRRFMDTDIYLYCHYPAQCGIHVLSRVSGRQLCAGLFPFVHSINRKDPGRRISTPPAPFFSARSLRGGNIFHMKAMLVDRNLSNF